MSEDLEMDIRRADQAAHAMEVLKPKFDLLERELFDALAEINMHDTASKDEILRTVKNLRKLKAALERDIAAGDLARHLTARATLRDKLRGVVNW